MSTSFEKYQKRKLKSSYFSVILSIAFVLFMLGLFGLLVLNTKKISDYFKEQASITIFLKDEADSQEVKNLQTLLKSEAFTKSIIYISKEEAAEIAKKENGEDFMEFLGYNPLKNAIDLYLKADYVSTEKMAEIENELVKNNVVHEVSYDKPLISLLNENIKKISLWILIFSGIFTFIAMLLISNSIRLSVYAKRFTIKTMQMVGATKRFIRKPFVLSSIKLGALGSIVALIALAIALYYLNKNFPQFGFLENRELLGILFGSIFLLGILITWISAFFATQRFLNLRTDQLYY
ncbi:MAG: permease-like cell division protein FtsX [Flavobacteriaceae bacterium]|jgi:cell division transport system permease protein|nr:permease-like cell division protein FtsX [Flavobacteriaceae bacterium]